MAKPETRIARKDYLCNLCSEQIKKSSVYQHQRVAPWEQEDGEEFYAWRTHIECQNLWLEFRDSGEGCDYDLNEFKEYRYDKLYSAIV